MKYTKQKKENLENGRKDTMKDLSLVTLMKDVPDKVLKEGGSIKQNDNVLYFGEIANMLGHGVFMKMDTNQIIVGLHIEDFRPLTDEEV